MNKKTNLLDINGVKRAICQEYKLNKEVYTSILGYASSFQIVYVWEQISPNRTRTAETITIIANPAEAIGHKADRMYIKRGRIDMKIIVQTMQDLTIKHAKQNATCSLSSHSKAITSICNLCMHRISYPTCIKEGFKPKEDIWYEKHK